MLYLILKKAITSLSESITIGVRQKFGCILEVEVPILELGQPSLLLPSHLSNLYPSSRSWQI